MVATDSSLAACARDCMNAWFEVVVPRDAARQPEAEPA
jgi:hypothetical protein